MPIRIIGENPNYPKEELRQTVKFFLKKLLKEKMDTISLIISQTPRVHDGEEELYGCMNTYFSHPHRFNMSISTKYKKRTQRKILAHECKHIEQYVSGKMKETKTSITWKKKKIKGDIAHDNLPWEKDANAAEISLVRAYLRHMRKHRSNS